jgi:hypothetical protein
MEVAALTNENRGDLDALESPRLRRPCGVGGFPPPPETAVSAVVRGA